jgi:hypothetical protein
VQQTVAAGNPSAKSGPFTIGDGAGYFQGFIADVQLYNTSLSQSEIKTLYAEGMGGAPVNIEYLAGWWPLNGDTRDYSGDELNGQTPSAEWISNYQHP